MGKFGFDAALVIDILSVVAMMTGLGALTRTFQSLLDAGKAGYLVGMAANDTTQGILLGVEAARALDDVKAEFQGAMAGARTEHDRRQAQQHYEQASAEIVGGAIASASFVVVSVAGGVVGASKQAKLGSGAGHSDLPSPTRPPAQLAASGDPLPPTVKPPARVVEEPKVPPVPKVPEHPPAPTTTKPSPDAAELKLQAEIQKWNVELIERLKKENPGKSNKEIAKLAAAALRTPNIPFGYTAESFKRAQSALKQSLAKEGFSNVKGYATGSRVTGATMNPSKPQRFGQTITEFAGRDFDVTLITDTPMTNSQLARIKKAFKAEVGQELGIRNVSDKRELAHIPVYGKIDLEL